VYYFHQKIKGKKMRTLQNSFLVAIFLFGTLCGMEKEEKKDNCPFSPKEIKGLESLWGVMGPILGKIDKAVEQEPNTHFPEHVSKVFEHEYQNNEKFKELLDFKNQEKPGDVATRRLFASCQNRDFNGVKQAIQDGARVESISESRGVTPLAIAAYVGSFEICKYLLERGGNPDDRGGRSYYDMIAPKSLMMTIPPQYIVRPGRLVVLHGVEHYVDVTVKTAGQAASHALASYVFRTKDKKAREREEKVLIQIAAMFLNFEGIYKQLNGLPTLSAAPTLDKVTYDPLYNHHPVKPEVDFFGCSTPSLPEDCAKKNGLFKLAAYFKKARVIAQEKERLFFESIDEEYLKEVAADVSEKMEVEEETIV
jgi:hypothetical protein